MWVTDDARVRKHAKTTEITSFCQITYIKICIFCRTSISIFFTMRLIALHTIIFV
jgi:hypothetical protein